jgi:glycerophosphoryl diester phosphodiesterase
MPNQGICAHRGAKATHPENSLSAFREAIRLGVHMIEFDVYKTQDDSLVVIHDKTVDRTTNGSGLISDMSLSELKKLDAGSWKSPDFSEEKIPTLSEVLSIMPRNIWLNVHIKDSPQTGKQAAIKIQDTGRLHQAFLACDSLTAVSAKQAVPDILICNMDRQEFIVDYVSITIKRKANFLQFYRTPPEKTPEFIPLLKQFNVTTNYCCTDDWDTIKILLKSKVNFVLVNDPKAAMSIVSNLGIKPISPVF